MDKQQIKEMMQSNYLLVYQNIYTNKIEYRYFKTKDDLDTFINTDVRIKRFYKVLHKYQIKEID